MDTTHNTTAFKTGETYTTHLQCDSEKALTYVVVKRTAKFVTLQDECGDVKRVGVRTFRNVEACSPDGTYSLAPVLFAGAR